MKNKRLLRFYFKADDLERALDNLILYRACASADSAKGGEFCAQKIIALVAAKDELSSLWNYIDGVMQRLAIEEREVLKGYALARCGIKRLPKDSQRAVKKCVVKFVRHARNIERFGEGIKLVNEYYCLM